MSPVVLTLPRTSRLQDKVCVVTGAGTKHGIGRSSAIRFAHEGARHLYLLDTDESHFSQLQSELQDAYPEVKVTTIVGDASDEDTISGICKRALEEEGRLDVFFANAGICASSLTSFGSSFKSTSVDDFMKTLRVNVVSCFLALKYAPEAMMRTEPTTGKFASGGSIVLTSSISGIRAAGPMDYSASKAAINSLAQVGSYENQLARTGVRVNSICPGTIITQMSAFLVDHLRAQEVGGDSQQGLGIRVGQPEEVANLVLFLASDESSYVTGQNYAIDNGISNAVPLDKLSIS